MNNWNKFYFNNIQPKKKADKEIYNLLEKVNDKIIVHFPEFKSIFESQNHPAYNKEFIITYNETDIPNGKMSVNNLISNVRLWESRNYQIDF